MRRIISGLVLAGFTTGAFAAPLTPTITGHDFNFGAFNPPGAGPEWSTGGFAPDSLSFGPGGNEVTAYWPAWPTPPVHPVFDPGGVFGGDLLLSVIFTGQDAPYVGPGGTLDVSLTGTGASPAGPDLIIFGAIPSAGFPFGPLWEIDLERVSLYGYAGSTSYVLEGVGVITGGIVAQQHQLIGETGVMRGNLDFIDAPPGWIPSLYDPLRDPIDAQFRAAYSGETGVGYAVPEPVSLSALALGAFGLLARRRRK